MKPGMNRRQFIGRSLTGAAAAPLAARALRAEAGLLRSETPPSDRIAVGIIGVGARVQADLLEAAMAVPGVEIVGVCDAYTGRVERAIERTGGRAKDYGSYRALLADKSIDAVIISTPDHWHRQQTLDAMAAGKDVYLEKPMTLTIDEGPEMIAAAERHRRILQIGSQGMSSKLQETAREMIRSGRLGQITLIRATYDRNTDSGAWLYPIPPDANERTVNWEAFLGPAPQRPLSLERFFRWRCYWDYSGGIATDLFVHLMTTIHFVMGATMAERVVATGENYRHTKTHEVPDTLNAVLTYPKEGFTVSLGATFNNSSSSESGFAILGTEGSLVFHGGQLTLGADGTVILNGDTGISAGFKDELDFIKGNPRTIPLYSTVSGPGNNAMFTIVKFAGIRILDVKLTGSPKYVTVQPAFVIDSTVVTQPGNTASDIGCQGELACALRNAGLQLLTLLD